MNLPGVRLWYEDTSGSGAPVVFLHARSGTADSWAYQVPAFSAAGYRCITYDRRDSGRSEPDPSGDQPGYAVDDLHALVERLGLDRFHLVSTAGGGVVGLDYVASHPERLRCQVVADTIAGVQDPQYLEVQQRLRPAEIQALPVPLRELSAGYRGTNPEGTRRWIEIEHASRWTGSQQPGQERRNVLTLAMLQKLSVPTLLLAGEADLVTPPALMRLVAAAIPNCRFATVPEAGHAAHWEQPEIWNHHALEFLAEY